MSLPRKLRIRLFVALGAAVLLAVALAYTSFNAAASDVTAGELLASAQPGRSYELAGTVSAAHRSGDVLSFRIRDPRHARISALVRYSGSVPDPFKVGRGVVVTVRKRGSIFVGEPNSLITRCPSKFLAESEGTGPGTAAGGPVLGR
ncbi:MAG: cytochrome c maturation protein CcmE [Actinobacteria bacterium]|nr:cytochrome c maturation protein CcmE [Actinomycetota bacterium]